MHQQSDGSVVNLGPDSGINRIDETVSASLTVCTDDSVCLEDEACLPLTANTPRCRNPCETRSDCPADELCHARVFVSILPARKTHKIMLADIDRDGDSDLLVGGRDTGGGRPNFLFRNDIGSQNRWLAIEVEGDGKEGNS